MLPITEIALRQIEIYSIIFIRVSGIILMIPFFGSENVPRLVRIGLSLVITLVLVPTLEISGIHMHRIEGITPWEDSIQKVKSIWSQSYKFY